MLTVAIWAVAGAIAAAQSEPVSYGAAADTLIEIIRRSLRPEAAATVAARPRDLVAEILASLPAVQQNVITAQNRLPAREHLVALSDGRPVWVAAGGPGHVVITAEQDAQLYRSGAQIVLVHNHPTGEPLSGVDLEQLAKPGVAAVVALGNDGSVYVASAGPRFDRLEFLHQHHPQARRATEQEFRYRRTARVQALDIDLQFEHVVATALYKADIIRYRALLAPRRQRSYLDCRPLCGTVSESVASTLRRLPRLTRR